MKARVKQTGEIIDGKAMVSFNGDDFYLDEFEIIQDETDKVLYDELDEVYWANMKHQYAGMAMQAMISNSHNTDYHKDWSGGYGRWTKYDNKELAEMAVYYATALVEKLKEKEERE